jgi:general secretion pathway protein G
MIELIVVMAVIALLLSIAVPRYFLALERGKAQVQQQNLTLLREAIDKYYGDNARYPDQLEDLVSKRYLRAIPIDPMTEAADWEVIAAPDPSLGNVYDVQSTKPAVRESSASPGGESGAQDAAPAPGGSTGATDGAR